MDKNIDPLKDIIEIRSMMEKSSKFLSLSGLSGVSAGIIGLAGSFVLLQKFKEIEISGPTANDPVFFISVALMVLIFALSTAIFFTTRNAKKKNLPLWTTAAKYLLISLIVPLSVGGVFSILLWYRGFPEMIFSATMVFYGLALWNASKYVMNEIRYLAFLEIILGLIAGVSYGLILWAVGFGVMHIVYGIYMYLKYEK